MRYAGDTMRAVVVCLVIGSSAQADVKREPPVVSIQTKVSKAKTESTLTVEQVSAKVQQSYVGHIERCYRDRFGLRPTTSGELRLAFGVEPNGKTIGVVVAGFDKKLAACVAERARTWTFTPPRDKAEQPVSTSFVLEYTLTALASPAPKPRAPLEDEAARYAEMLTSEGEHEVGDMERRTPGSDLGSQLRDVGPVTGGGASGRGSRSGPSGRITVTSKRALDATTLTASAMLSKVQGAYMAGLKRCYVKVLATNPTLKGNVQLAFTVDATGKMWNTSVTSFHTTLDTCVKAASDAWRFAPPTSGGKAATARFELSLSLVPE